MFEFLRKRFGTEALRAGNDDRRVQVYNDLAESYGTMIGDSARGLVRLMDDLSDQDGVRSAIAEKLAKEADKFEANSKATEAEIMRAVAKILSEHPAPK